MSPRPSPTVRRRRLRYELRRLRAEHGLTIEQVQDSSGGDIKAPSISRWENGERSVRPTDLRLLLDIYEVDGDQREALLALARQAKERGWWQSYASAIPEYFQVYLGLEAEASLIREYAAELVPGLLQTADYSRAFLHAPPCPAGEEELARRVTVRLARQERLTAEDPPEYWAVLNEAVIRRPVGGPAVMREQLGRLAELAALPNVNIQVLPFAAGEHSAMEGAFSTLDFPEPSDPGVIYLENQAGSLYLEQPAEIDHYARMFNHLSAKALDPDESRRMIIQGAADLTGLPA
jgi:transcriptional regulator with XRE-family HTH domain